MLETFYLGAHHPDWLARAGVPLFVSRRSLAGRKTFPRAIAPWALDSGGFTELDKHGGWMLQARAYAAEVRRFRDEIGLMQWAAPMDWMVEAEKLARTGSTIAEHQARTVANYVELRSIAPDLPWIPVLQGWTLGDYIDHQEAYARAGVELSSLPLVGVGSVCRRERTHSIANLFAWLSSDGLRLHGFGVKKQGLRLASEHMVSADSMAWSFNAYKNFHERIPGHTHEGSCSNCIEWALGWREEALAKLGRAA